MVFDPQVFHVLAADVDDRGDTGLDEFRGAIVRHCFDFALVHGQGRGDQTFAVSGCAGSTNHGAFGQLRANAADDVDGRSDGVAFVGGIVGEDDPVVFVDDDGFDGG